MVAGRSSHASVRWIEGSTDLRAVALDTVGRPAHLTRRADLTPAVPALGPTGRPPSSGRRPLSAGARRVAAYAALPRPQELATKPLVLVTSYVAGRWASPTTGPPLLAVLGVLVALEVLAYQARYTVNDLLDARLDAEHPASRQRRRLPQHRGARLWALASVAARLAAGLGLTLLLPPSVRGTGAAAIVAVVVAAIPYEVVRQHLRRSTPCVTAVGRLTPAVVGVFVLAGAGFTIRIGTGLALAGAPMPVLAVAAGFAWPFGVLFTTSSWALQATSFVTPDWKELDGRVARKRQLGPLLRWAGAYPSPRPAPTTPPTETKVLAGAWPLPSAAGVAAVGAAVGAAAVGTTLATRFQPGTAPMWWVAAVGILCVTGTVHTVRRSHAAGLTFRRGALTVAATVVMSAAAGAEAPVLAGLPIAALLITVGIFRRLTYRDVVAFIAPSPGPRSIVSCPADAEAGKPKEAFVGSSTSASQSPHQDLRPGGLEGRRQGPHRDARPGHQLRQRSWPGIPAPAGGCVAETEEAALSEEDYAGGNTAGVGPPRSRAPANRGHRRNGGRWASGASTR